MDDKNATQSVLIEKLSSVQEGVIVDGCNVAGDVIGLKKENIHVYQCEHEQKKEIVKHWTKLKDNLKRRYTLDDRWLCPMLGKNFKRMNASDYLVDLNFSKLHGTELDVVIQDNVSLKEALDLNNFQVLIIGDSGFGKTSLCCKLAYDWAKEDGVNSALRVTHTCLIFYRLKDLEKDISLEECLVQFVHSVMPDDELPKTREAIAITDDRFIIVLDGYDEVSEDRREDIKRLLATCNSGATFKNPFVVITSREVLDGAFMSCFEVRLMISGLSSSNMDLFVEKYFIANVEMRKAFQMYLRDICRNYGSGFSPFLLYLLCYLYSEESTEFKNVDLSLEKLVPRIVHLMARRCNERGNYGLSEDELSRNVNILAELLVLCRENRRYALSKEIIERYAGDSFKFITECGILKPLRDNLRIFEPIHQLFLEYHPIQITRQEDMGNDSETYCVMQSKYVTEVHFMGNVQDSGTKWYITIGQLQSFRKKSWLSSPTSAMGHVNLSPIIGFKATDYFNLQSTDTQCDQTREATSEDQLDGPCGNDELNLQSQDNFNHYQISPKLEVQRSTQQVESLEKKSRCCSCNIS